MFKNRPKLSGFLTGFAVTILCTVYFFVVDPEQNLELLAFDLRVRQCNTLERTTPIVHVDIDDGSLERVGRWPWRRDQLADVIRILDELGAAIIAVDLLLSDPEAPFVNHPAYTRDADVEPAVKTRGELSGENVVFGDLELANAIRAAGNVFLAIQMDVRSPDEPDSDRDRLRAMWAADRYLTPVAAIERLGLKNTPGKRAYVGREILRLWMSDLLRADFTRTDQTLAEALDTDLARVATVIAGAKSDLAQELVGRLFEGGAEPTREAVLEAVLGAHKDRNNADRVDVLAAYRAHLGLRASRKSMHRLDAGVAARFSRAGAAVPPHFLLARAALDIGTVNFKTDSDGGTRRVPLLVSYQGRAVKHLGFAVACHLLGLDADRITMSEDRILSIPRRDGRTCSVPVDETGNLVINWTRTAQHWRDFEDFPHISAAKIWAIVDARRESRANEIANAYDYADIVATAKGAIQVRTDPARDDSTTAVGADHVFRGKVRACLDFERELHLAGLRGELTAPELSERRRQLTQMRDGIEREWQQAVSLIEATCSEIEQVPREELENDPEAAREAERFKAALRLVRTEIAQRQAANRRLAETIASLKRELAGQIENKYVFVGFAATAAGDIVTTPVDPSTNGVICHAQVLNSFLQNRFITRADRFSEILLCLGLGALVSVITALSGPRLALLSMLFLVVAYVLLNAYVVFMRLHVWLAVAAMLVTIAVTWAMVTLFRQLTAERERRFFAKQLGQYTSPAIAAKIAESPEAAQAFKTVQTRDVTCFFSDLRGFTTITEQEDAEVVQYVLNTYLERMSQAIWSGRGLINKFMGDGIMAFFNPSVDPLPDHARVASETSLVALNDLEELKVEQKDHPASRVFDRLHMRIGVATGLCKNGDLGSELKADYTVIGDIVNLAARLEPANKVFGTQIMVSGPTREVVKDRYEFRYLAELQVKGKSQTVPAYELVCRKGELTGPQREYIERFEAGVALYKERNWDACISHFTRIVARRPDDVGASRYIDACQELKTFPPDDDWRGALELKEK